MIVAWVLFPLLALLIFVGCGLLVERLAGVRLPGTILASVGLALVIVAATLTTYKSATAKLTTAVVVVLALGGYASSVGRVRDLRPDGFALALGLLLFAVFAAPVVLSGNATFLGYYVLNDSAIHFTLIDQLLAHGRDLSSIHTSSLVPALHGYLSSAYPVGAQVALGALRPLVGQNVAWIFQPYLAVILSFGGVAIYELLEEVIVSRPLRAVCAFVAAQAGLVYAYYLEASIKELATTWIITLVVALVIATLRRQVRVRRMVPLAVATVAAFDVLGAAVVPWLGVPVAVFAALALWRTRRAILAVPKRRLALLGGACAVAVGIAAAPFIATASSSFDVLSSQLTKRGDLGNLVHPLSKWQLLGIWPSGDFRLPVAGYPYQISHAALITNGLIGLAVASAVLGTVWSVLRRAGGPLLLLAGSGIAAIYLLTRASPYAAAKVLMIFSLAVVAIVMLGPAALADLGVRWVGRRWIAAVPAWTLAGLLAAGVLWTNVDAYAGARLAPRPEYTELESIGRRFAGEGPAFYNLGDEFALHFLRSELPTVPAFGRPTVLAGLPPRTRSQAANPWDIDELDQAYLQSFPLLVLGRSPRSSRPPADYRRVFEGHFFEVWRRAEAPRVLEHFPLGGGIVPVTVPNCASVMSLATRAVRLGARLAFVPRVAPFTLLPDQMRYVARSARGRLRDVRPELAQGETAVYLHRAGLIRGLVTTPHAGRYEIWLEGEYSRQVRIRLDGRLVGWSSYEVGPPGQYLPIGSLDLVAGAHELSVEVPDESLSPGELGRGQAITSIVVALASGPVPVSELEPRNARSLCGHRLDWIEIVR